MNTQRYFFVSYTYAKEKSWGFGNISFCNDKYPSLELINSKISEPNIVVLNIQELSEQNFSELLGN